MGWYDYTFDCSPLWEGVDVNLAVMDQVFAPEAFGGYQVGPLEVPTFLALGRYDYMIPFSLWDRPKQRLTDLRYKLYEKSGHHPPYEQPDEFCADLTEWAKDLDCAAASQGGDQAAVDEQIDTADVRRPRRAQERHHGSDLGRLGQPARAGSLARPRPRPPRA